MKRAIAPSFCYRLNANMNERCILAFLVKRSMYYTQIGEHKCVYDIHIWIKNGGYNVLYQSNTCPIYKLFTFTFSVM